jgi:hypothetical protein
MPSMVCETDLIQHCSTSTRPNPDFLSALILFLGGVFGGKLMNRLHHLLHPAHAKNASGGAPFVAVFSNGFTRLLCGWLHFDSIVKLKMDVI